MKHGIIAAVALALSATPLLANAPGESRPYQFRSANERQVHANIERFRQEVRGDLGVGSAGGLGSGVDQIANFIQVIGDNNIVEGTTQDNTGDQQQTTGDNSPIGSDNILNLGDGGN